MKLNKKLLVFVLSLVMLIGMFAVAAFAADGDAGVLTVKYQDGTVQTYAEGEEIVPPAIPKDFLVFEDGKAYKYTVSGDAWEGLPAAVTPELLGTTVDVTVAGTKDARQVYYVTEEQLAADAPITVVYHMNNNVHEYLSSKNTGDKGDGTNIGASSAQVLGSTGSAGLIRIKLYADVDVASFSMNIKPTPRKEQQVNTFFDLNGHTVKTSQQGFIDGQAVGIRIYSSVPGAHWYMTAASQMFRANDDNAFYLGAMNEDGLYAENISFHGKELFGETYGGGAQIWGGKYYQTAAGADGFFADICRRIYFCSNAEFHVLGAVFGDSRKAHDGASVAAGSVAIQNCKFYAPSETPILVAKNAAKLVFENCTFVNFNLASSQGTGTITLKSGCVSNLSAGAAYGDVALAHMSETAITFTAADGSAINATVGYKALPVAETLKISTSAGADYWTVGTAFSTSAGDYIKFENGKIYANPVYDLADVPEIVDGKIAAAGEISLAIIFTKEDIAAFTYLDTKTGKLYGVGYETECGGTAAGVGEKFHEIFSVPASAYTITMYQDMILSKGVHFGPTVAQADDYNRDYYNSLVKGSIVWDLNGTTVTIASNVTGLANLAAANFKLSTPNTLNANKPAVFGFECNSLGNSFTIKSSVPGGKLVNESTAAICGIGEGKKAKIIFEGENLTVESLNGYIVSCIEVADASTSTQVDINGGTYIGGTATALFRISRHASIKNATLIATNASVTQVIYLDGYRPGSLALDNVIMVSANAAALTFKPVSSSNKYSVTVTDCAFVNCVPSTTATSTQLSSVTYDGANIASTDANLSLIYASAPAGTAKVDLELVVANAEGGVDKVAMVGYVSADKVLSVTYSGANITKNYLVGKVFAPIAMDAAYYTVTFDLVGGTANIPVAWANIPAAGSVVLAGGTMTATPAENNVPLAFALYDNALAAVSAYAVADSDAIAAALVAGLAAQANAGKLYVYADLEAPALTVAKDLELLLNGKTLTLGGALTVAAPLTVEAGAILSAEAKPFVLSSDVTLNGTTVYLAAATTVFSGAGNVALSDVVVYNLGAGALADTVVVAVNGAKFMGVSLGATVTVSGTVLGTAGTFAGCAYADGVVSGLIVNNNSETVAVLGNTYTVNFAEAATDDVAKAIFVTYEYKGIVRGNQKYFYGSVADFYRVYADGYYFEYKGTAALTENVTYECIFRADAKKVRSQISLTDALNFTFLLKVEDPGVLANLKINGAAIDFATLATKTIDGAAYYVIPVAFDSFADALDNYVLSVDLINGDEALTVSATAELHSYLDSVLSTAEENDAKKAYAVAEYVATLIAYFDYDFSFGDARLENLSRLNSILANYAEYKVENALPTEAEKITSNYVKSVVLVANEQVTFAFRIANGFAGTVEINGAEVELAKSFEGFNRDYASVDVAFTDLDQDITVVVKDAEGAVLETITYSLADYLVGVAAQNEGAIGEYAKALWNLSKVVG